MDLKNKVIGFEFDAVRSVSNHERFYQDIVVNCARCLCCLEAETVCDFNLQGIFALSQEIILLELTHNLMISISICLCSLTWFQNPCHI